MLLHDALPSTSGRHEEAFASLQHLKSRRTRKPQTIAQAAATQMAPSNGPVVRDNLEAPEALKDVERVNPMSDRFEVRSSVLFVVVSCSYIEDNFVCKLLDVLRVSPPASAGHQISSHRVVVS